MKAKRLLVALLGAVLSGGAVGQVIPDGSVATFEGASADLKGRLTDALSELDALREEIRAEQIPLSERLRGLENELLDAREEAQRTSRLLDTRTLDLTNLRNEIRGRENEADYLSRLLGDYLRNLESRLHIAELQRWGGELERGREAAESRVMGEYEKLGVQADLLELSIERLEESLGGMRFRGTAVDGEGTVQSGEFLMIGPAGFFVSSDGSVVGTAEQRVGSLEPAVIEYKGGEDAAAARAFAGGTGGDLPLDVTLGDAHKIEAIEESWMAEVAKGGPVMYPIFALAGAALLVALFKWVGLMLVKRPNQKKVREMLGAVRRREQPVALAAAQGVGGPTGEMLTAGVEHLQEPRELIEEVMFEAVLATRLKMNRFLPFIQISAAAAPLLGLLGTVTGIINTFALITVFGTGDVKTLSGGISEALITTKYGLIVAIPSLLLHAFLSRKARSVVDDMEKSAVALMNEAGRAKSERYGTAA